MSRLCSCYTYTRPIYHSNRVQSICVKMSALQDLFFCLSHKACSCKPPNKALMPAGICVHVEHQLPPSAFTTTLKPYNPCIMIHFYSPVSFHSILNLVSSYPPQGYICDQNRDKLLSSTKLCRMCK